MDQRVVSREERLEHLRKEKEFDHQRDALSAECRDLPYPQAWLRRHDEY